MAHAYTPGLKVTDSQLVRKIRLLPLKGDVLVTAGQKVGPDDVIARTLLPGQVVPLNVANKLGVAENEVVELMLKREGESIRTGEVIAENKPFLGLKFLKGATCTATIDGTIESISKVTGQVLQRGAPTPVEVKAYVAGTVVEILPREGAIVACTASYIQGIFGIGGETHGDIVVVVPDNRTILSEELISDKLAGKIIVGGSLVTAGALRKAMSCGVRGIVVGGFDDKDLRDFLGKDIGVAITGNEDIPTTLVVTEGFGQIDMAHRTFELLQRLQGKAASINGATQIRAGVIRPEIVVPLEVSVSSNHVADKPIEGIRPGSPIRVIRHPYFGRLGKVVDLPAPLQKLGSESMARVLEVEFDDGKRAVVPRANVEMIES